MERIITEDGSPTLLNPQFGATYSSRHGAVMQAKELYLGLTKTSQHTSPKVLEVGFGLGINFRVTLENALMRGVPLHYIAYEAFPVEVSILQSIQIDLIKGQAIWQQLLNTWPQVYLEGDWGSLQVHIADVSQASLPLFATSVYLDPFGPEVNPEPWRPAVLQKLFSASQSGALLATFSVQGQFRRDLAGAGFSVQKVPGLGKKHWTLAEKP
jgi:tRNA U34 5-methylaminomethyl-2-thiouridine-forming methyltransferase MnmC